MPARLLAGGSSFSELGAAAPAATGGGEISAKPRPLPRCTKSRRAFLRALSRHARFAGLPEEGEEGGAPASATVAEPADLSSASSTAASPGAALLTGKQPGGALVSSTKGTSTGRPTVSSRLQRGSGGRGSSYDQQVAAELQDADGASDFSGISGNSSSELLLGWEG